eukprot:62012-Amphidinium_carterae.1
MQTGNQRPMDMAGKGQWKLAEQDKLVQNVAQGSEMLNEFGGEGVFVLFCLGVFFCKRLPCHPMCAENGRW